MSTLNTIAATEFNIKYYINDKLEFYFKVYRGGVAVDLSAKVMEMQVKRRKTDAVSIAVFKTSDATMVVSGGDSNIVTCSLSANPFKAGYYVHDLQDVTSEETICFGSFWAIQDVTRP